MRRLLKAAHLPVGSLLAAALLSGCSMQLGPEAPTVTGAVALSPDDVDQMLADWSERRLTALSAARPPDYSIVELAQAETGPMLEVSTFSTLQSEVERTRPAEPEVHVSADRVYAPLLAQHPQWAAVVLDTRSPEQKLSEASGKGSRTSASTRRSLVVYSRAGAVDQWRAESAVEVDVDRLPLPSVRASATARLEERAARQVQADVERFWTDGAEQDWLVVDEETLEERHEVVRTLERGASSVTITASPWIIEDQGVRVVRADGGHLAVTVSRLELRVVPRPGKELEWPDGYSQLYGSDEDGLYQHRLLTSVLWLPDSGPPEVLGSDLRKILHSSTS